MVGSTALIAALKRRLKAHGMTYRDVAPLLGLSEASVKRLFSRGDFTLARIERICAALEISLGDLVREAEEAHAALRSLTPEQERELISSPDLLMVAVLVVQGWTFEQILACYELTEHELIRALAHLDRLRLIDLLPGNRIRRLVAPNFTWVAGGPIERFLAEKVRARFLRGRFAGPGESMRFVHGMLSARSLAILQRRIEQLAREFDDLQRADQHLGLDERQGSSLLLALRPWDFFADRRRRSPEKRGGD